MTGICPSCGEAFAPSERPRGRTGAFCSDECALNDWRAVHLTPGRMRPRFRSVTWWRDAGSDAEADARAARWAAREETHATE
jgi:hypothetical protein